MLNSILAARENRALLKKRLSEAQKASFSFSLNIPGYPKTTHEITEFFKIVLSDLLNFMAARLIILTDKIELIDEAGNFFLAAIYCSKSIDEVKSICESFEATHPLGRFLDIDITNGNGVYISSGKSKPCFYCGKDSAINCMKAKNHSFEDLRKFQETTILKYLKEKKSKVVSKQLANFAMQAILYEITLSPKPGLVDFQTSGAHRDMDYFTFIDSSAAIFPYFQEIAELGYNYKGEINLALPLIRNIGLAMESDMFVATHGVNTQKGNIFLMGIALFTSAYVINKCEKFDISMFSVTAAQIGAQLMDEFDIPTEKKSHGQVCVEKYGKEIAGGARFEVASGFATVINYGLPVLDNEDISNFNALEKQNKLLDVLLSLMAHNNDTNILYRSSLNVLEEMKLLAQKVLDSTNKNEKSENFNNLTQFCNVQNISPGGSADLLAIVVFLDKLKERT